MTELDIEVAHWLTTGAGQACVDEATEMLDENLDEFATTAAVRSRIGDPARTSAVLGAALGRQKARSRWPNADTLLVTRAGLEQASDPTVSSWRAKRFQNRHTYDLCAGIGGDTTAIAELAAQVQAVDLDPARLHLLEHQVRMAGLQVETHVADALEVIVEHDAVVHADPGRRDAQGRRIVDPRQTHPPVDALFGAHRGAAGIGIVVAPGFDAEASWLPKDIEVEYVQLGTQLVEATVWRGCVRRANATASATLLPAPAGAPAPLASNEVFHRTRSGPRPPRLAVAEVGEQLIQVAPAAVRARMHDDIGAEIGATRIAHHRALLSAVGGIPPSPWYQARTVLTVLPARARSIRQWLNSHGHGPVELVSHGFQFDPARFWRALGKPPRGPDGIRIELVRRDHDAVAVITDA